MKRTLHFLLSALLGVALIAPAFGDDKTPIKVACVGDSITAGVGTKNPGNDAYPAQLAKTEAGSSSDREVSEVGSVFSGS